MRAVLSFAVLFSCACHAAPQPQAKVAEPVELPKAPPPPASTPLATIPEMGPGNFTMVIDFSVLRAHPAGKQLGVLIPALPVWRQSLPGSKIDALRDIDWMSIEGPNVHDASHDVTFVHYSAADADVEAVVTSLIAQRSSSPSNIMLDVGEKDVRAWQLVQRRSSVAFLRPKNDHVLAMVPLSTAREQAHALASTVVRAPRTGRAVDIRATNPHSLAAVMPAAFTDERIQVSPKGDGATLHLEGDCVDEASATVAAAELEDGVRQRNSLPVKMATRGLFTPFKAIAKGKMVVADLDASAEQLDAILRFTAMAEGANLP